MRERGCSWKRAEARNALNVANARLPQCVWSVCERGCVCVRVCEREGDREIGGPGEKRAERRECAAPCAGRERECASVCVCVLKSVFETEKVCVSVRGRGCV